MLVIDIEATGTDATIHSMLSIGAIDGTDPVRQFYGECRRFDGAHVMSEALAVNGFTMEQIDDGTKPTEAELVQQFISWAALCRDVTLCGQNVSFDRSYIEAACKRAGIAFPFPHRTFDTHTMCYMHMTQRGILPPFDAAHKHTALNLNAVLNYCGIPSEPNPHNALTGAKCHAEVATRLLHGKGLLPEFSQYPMLW
jgi:DNA polymerase III epsilon subunit-like protein